MKNCDRHFGDSTAHETAKWFLDQLESYDDINIFSEYFDKLCKDLNAVRFVDCLRKQVDENKKIFECIEKIAAKLLEEKHNNGRKEFEDYPNLSVLLLSIAQSSLLTHDSVENTKLYEIGNNLYETFKNNSNLAHIDLALKAGFQLSKFQHDSNWKLQFSEFKNNHYERLTVIRRQYFSADNNPATPSTFSLHVVKRYKLKIDNHSKDDNQDKDDIQDIKHAYLREEFKVLDPEKDFLRPLYLQLPILARSTESMRLADRFVQSQDSKSDIEFSKSLAEKLRILQWGILGRNLVEEDKNGTLSFYRIKKKVEIQGVQEKVEIQGVPEKDFLINTVEETRFVECLFSPEEGEIPMQQRAEVSPKELSLLMDDPEGVKEAVEKCYDSFRDDLLPKVLDFHPRAYEDLVRSFAEIGDKSKTSNAVLIEDGELSFFSILWLLRYAEGKGEAPENWDKDPSKKLSVRFRPSKDKSRDNWWSQCDLYEFAEECGLIIRLPNTEKCILTQRWRSLITWLGRINSKLIELTGKREEQIQAVERVVKKLADDEGKSFVEEDLRKFFAPKGKEKDKEDLKELIGKLRVFSPLPMQCTHFAKEQFGPLVKLLGPLLKAESTGLDDKVLLRRCRASFIPLEHLFRAYWPCELHLLIQALNWEESFVKDASMADVDMAPISLGFATIAGKVETDWNLKGESESSPESTSEFDHWLVPYRTLFSTLSNNLTLIDVKESSERIGEQIGTRTQKQYFAHQTSGLLNTVWLDPKRVDLSFESRVAIWMARIHVQEVWGGFPIDTKKLIYQEDFPDWERFENREIVERLVHLGVQGGIMRASKPDVGRELQEYAWDLGGELKNANPEKVKRIISKFLSALLFHLPETTPPPTWVNTKAFAVCFFHGMRQAVYHALNNKRKDESCLWIDWNDHQVSIFNRGGVTEQQRHNGVDSKDREFFEHFVKGANAFCHQHGIGEIFEVDGPEPAYISHDTWQLVIRKERKK